MRVVGHMAMAYRDLARVHILQTKWDSAIQTYQEMIQTLKEIDTTTSKFADEIRLVLLQSAERDKAILQALSSNSKFPNLPKDSLMHWRIEYFWRRCGSGAAENDEGACAGVCIVDSELDWDDECIILVSSLLAPMESSLSA